MAFPRLNALDQALDIAGSLTQSQAYTLGDEPFGFGAPITGQNGSAASITTFSTPTLTITGLTGMTTASIGRFLTITGAASPGNNGAFLISAFHSSSSVDVINTTGVASDANSGSISWIERGPYTLEDDINYIRTDRKLIKGTSNWYDAVPTYQRPTAIGTNIAASLSNIAGKTTDAVAYNVNRAFFGQTVASGNTLVTVTSVSNLKHSDAVDTTGVPVFDTGPFTGDMTSCYVHVVDGYADGYAGSELTVLSGAHKGERIFGVTYNGSSTSPNSVEVHFYSSPFYLNYTTSATAYTWEVGQPTTINLLYGYNERLDVLDANAFRTVPALGILTDATLSNRVNNLYNIVGATDGYTSLLGLLTNTTTYFPFFNLPDATPSVVEALNTLNEQIGNRTYTGAYLTSGQTITASLQALSTAIATSGTITRTIERLGSDVNAGAAHTLPGGLTYTTDGTNNGQFLWVFTRGILRDPGLISSGNDYIETSTTQITFYAKQKSGDHINYFTKA
jgi:hypothetical protein